MTDCFIYLDEGDLAEITVDNIDIFDVQGNSVERPTVQITDAEESSDKGEYRHYMLKEIYEQAKVLQNTLQGRVSKTHVLEEAFGTEAKAIFDQVQSIQILACGTSYHAGMIAKYWFEDWAGIPCAVEVASEYRYRKTVVRPNTLFVTISQSGETNNTTTGTGTMLTMPALGVRMKEITGTGTVKLREWLL